MRFVLVFITAMTLSVSASASWIGCLAPYEAIALKGELPDFPNRTPLTFEDRRLLAYVLDQERTLLPWVYQTADLLSSYVSHTFPGIGLSTHEGAVILSWSEASGKISALKPLGVAENEVVRIMKDLSAKGVVFEAIPERLAKRLESEDPLIDAKEDPYNVTYIHETDNLVALEGAKFREKRRYVNTFKRTYPQYQFHDLRERKDLFPKVRELAKAWADDKAKRSPEDAEDAYVEVESLNGALDRFDDLWLFGGAITVDGKVVAFTLGARKSRGTIAAIYEKADRAYKGSYQAVNQMFAERIVQFDRYPYIDRQSNAAEHSTDSKDDLSGPAVPLQGTDIKLSYHPDYIVKWYRVTPRSEPR